MQASIFNRRQVLVAGAGASLALRVRPAVAASRACVPTARQEEGPFYLPRERVRRDITEGKAGVPLRLELRLVDVRTCRPIADAAFDVWHCDALGVYSGYAGSPGGVPGGPPPGGMPGGPPPRGMPPGAPPAGMTGGPPPGGMPGGPPPGATSGNKADGSQSEPHASESSHKETFLRGVALTDRHGVARFTTIFPGFYAGRVNHVHVKIRLADAGHSVDTHVSYTGQIFFPESVAQLVSQHGPYAQHHIERTVLSEDRVYRTESGGRSVATLRPESAALKGGYTGALDFAIDPSARFDDGSST